MCSLLVMVFESRFLIKLDTYGHLLREFVEDLISSFIVFTKCICDICTILEGKLTDIALILYRFQPYWML
jgi:hypothetical protein